MASAFLIGFLAGGVLKINLVGLFVGAIILGVSLPQVVKNIKS